MHTIRNIIASILLILVFATCGLAQQIGGMPTHWYNAEYIRAIENEVSLDGIWRISGTLRVSDNAEIYHNGELRFYDNGNYVGFEAPSLSANQIWILPSADGTVDQYIKTDGSGTLSFATPAGGGGVSGYFIYIEEGDTSRVSNTAVDVYVDFDDNDFDVGVVGNEGNVTVNDAGIDHDSTTNFAANEHFTQANITTTGTVGTGTWQGTVLDILYGGTGSGLTDPGSDKMLFWDDSNDRVSWLVPNTGLSVSGLNLNWAAPNDSVTLTTHTTGNYAAGDAEAGNATSGDSATSFFSSGAIELARGGTGESLADPGDDLLTMWDETNSRITWTILGTGLSLSGNTLNATAGDITDIWDCSSGDCNAVTVESGETLTFSDDTTLILGTASDWYLEFDDSVDDQLLLHTTNTTTIADTDPMFEILADFGNANGTSMDADQQIFGVAKGTQASNVSVFSVDEDGDVDATGAFTSSASGDSYLQLTNNASISPSGHRLYIEGNVWKVSEDGTEETILTQEDSATLTGTSWDFSGVTNVKVPTGNSATADAEGEVAIDTDDDQWQMYVGGAAIVFDFTDDANNYILKSDGSGTLTMQADASGSPTWDTIGDPVADATIDHDAGEETNFDFTGNFTTGSQFKIEQKTGNPTGATLFEVKAADSDVTVAKLGDGTNMTQVDQAGNVTLAGTALITAGGVVLGDATPDAVGEFGYGSGIYKYYGANSEDFQVSVGSSSDVVTFTSGTGVNKIDFGTLDINAGRITGNLNLDVPANTDQLMMWDESGNRVTWTIPGSGLSFTENTLNVTESDPSVDTADEIEAILTNDAMDFGSGAVTSAGGFVGDVTGNADTATALWDADTDTGIQTQESADEDILRFDIGGTERMAIESTETRITSNVQISGGLNICLPATNNIIIDGRTNPREVTMGAMRWNHTPEASTLNTRALFLDIDANSVPNTQGLHIDLKGTGIAAGETVIGMDIVGDTANSTGGVIRLLELDKTGVGSAEVHGIHIEPEIAEVIHHASGTFIDPTQAWDENGGFTDTRISFSSSAADVTIFDADNDAIYIGADASFQEVEVVLDTGASNPGIKPIFEIWTGAAWTPITPIDNTAGFRESGIIDMEDVDLSSWAEKDVNGTEKFYLQITRTQNSLGTPPIEDLIQTAAVTDYVWDGDGNLTINSVTATGGFVGDLTGTADTANAGDSATSFFSSGAIELAYGGTGESLSDPEASLLMMWDDPNSRVTWTIPGTGLSISGNTLNVANSATGFFSSGTIEHERGGLEADVNAYSGLVGINGGSTSEVDTESELETHLGGLDVVTVTSDDISSANLITALSDETGSGIAVFGTSPEFTTSITFNAVTDTVAGIQNQNLVDKSATEEISGVWEIQDGVNLDFGNAADWGLEWNDTDTVMSLQTALSNGGSDDYGMITIAVDTGNAGMDANQEVFEIGKGGADNSDGAFVELFNIDEDGDVSIAGEVYAGTWASISQPTKLKIPTSDDPDVDTQGNVSYDTDGWLRTYDGTRQRAIRISETIQFAVQDPENMKTHAGRSNRSQEIWYNKSGMNFVITMIRALSDEDDFGFALYESASNTDVGTSNDFVIDRITCSVDGTACFYNETTSGFDDDTIATDRYLIFEDEGSDTAETLQVFIEGYFDGDVN